MPEAPQWSPETVPDTGPKTCVRCGTAVSETFHRVWSDNTGTLRGCRECLPRSVRFGEDPYNRDIDEIEFDVADANRGKDYGGIKEDRDAPIPTK